MYLELAAVEVDRRASVIAAVPNEGAGQLNSGCGIECRLQRCSTVLLACGICTECDGIEYISSR
eukprot:6205666-Prymnesium_polylepis.1